VDTLLGQVLEAHGGPERWRRYSKVEATIVTGGGFFPLEGVLQDSATCSTLRRIARSPRGAQRAGRLDNAVRVTPAMPSISASTSVRRTSSRCFSSILRRSSAAFAAACSASAAARGDCCRSRRRYLT